jgi:Ankyrin repeat
MGSAGSRDRQNSRHHPATATRSPEVVRRLREAIDVDDISAIEKLIREGADECFVDDDYHFSYYIPPLVYACRRDRPVSAEALIRLRAPRFIDTPFVPVPGDGRVPGLHPGDTALHSAAESSTGCLALLLRQRGIRVNIRNHAEETPLERAAGSESSGLGVEDTGEPRALERVRMLLEAGAEISARKRDGAFEIATSPLRPRRQIARLLLKHLDPAAPENICLLHDVAIRHSQMGMLDGIVRDMLERGFDPDEMTGKAAPRWQRSWSAAQRTIEVIIQQVVSKTLPPFGKQPYCSLSLAPAQICTYHRVTRTCCRTWTKASCLHFAGPFCSIFSEKRRMQSQSLRIVARCGGFAPRLRWQWQQGVFLRPLLPRFRKVVLL